MTLFTVQPSSRQVSTTASSLSLGSTNVALIIVIVGLVLSAGASLGFWLHRHRKHSGQKEESDELHSTNSEVTDDSSHHYVNLRTVQRDSHYQTSLPTETPSTPANYAKWSVIEKENAYRADDIADL